MADKERLDWICDSCDDQNIWRQSWGKDTYRIMCLTCGKQHYEDEKPE